MYQKRIDRGVDQLKVAGIDVTADAKLKGVYNVRDRVTGMTYTLTASDVIRHGRLYAAREVRCVTGPDGKLRREAPQPRQPEDPGTKAPVSPNRR